MNLLPLYTHDVFLLNPAPLQDISCGDTTNRGGGEDPSSGRGEPLGWGLGSGEGWGQKEGRRTYCTLSLCLLEEQDLFEGGGDGHNNYSHLRLRDAYVKKDPHETPTPTDP